jgi:hypothetical protein
LDFADPREDSSYLEAVLKEQASEGSEIADTGNARTKSAEVIVTKIVGHKEMSSRLIEQPIATSYMSPNAGEWGGGGG